MATRSSPNRDANAPPTTYGRANSAWRSALHVSAISSTGTSFLEGARREARCTLQRTAPSAVGWQHAARCDAPRQVPQAGQRAALAAPRALMPRTKAARQQPASTCVVRRERSLPPRAMSRMIAARRRVQRSTCSQSAIACDAPRKPHASQHSASCRSRTENQVAAFFACSASKQREKKEWEAAFLKAYGHGF